jgi:hypothetical protein
VWRKISEKASLRAITAYIVDRLVEEKKNKGETLSVSEVSELIIKVLADIKMYGADEDAVPKGTITREV